MISHQCYSGLYSHDAPAVLVWHSRQNKPTDNTATVEHGGDPDWGEYLPELACIALACTDDVPRTLFDLDEGRLVDGQTVGKYYADYLE